MDSEIKYKNATDASDTDESVSFDEVSTVAKLWMLNFMFLDLCRQFKEDDYDEFNEKCLAFSATSSTPNGNICKEKLTICAFLTRVMHGDQLDVEFEEEAGVMPLMSAAKVWSSLEYAVEDEMFKNIAQLLLVQSVAVCLVQGQRSSASSALKWFENNGDFSQHNLIVKLSTIVTKGETYHPFLVSFSFSRLLKSIKSFLDAYLEIDPCDYLFKEATKEAQSLKRERLKCWDEADISKENRKENEKKAVGLRTKRKLLSTKTLDILPTDSCKKSFVSLRRIPHSALSEVTSAKSMDTSKKWTLQLDKYLEAGVKRHGQGSWSRILMDFDFDGRTGTMLKDRWRVLMKTHKVG
ncbi:telomeric repeat-binding factor 1 isoform X2 [Cyclopterus lumpus]|uniref:telomeric repeat-binding factor 1 isoform X2 n=1 Tax=Cyclopterus lumpus TaxID=8103 RepID=UPI001485D372|nr:telomeric repeat-binding factor 1 isoform X2 [Cyclopterus lumpus]